MCFRTRRHKTDPWGQIPEVVLTGRVRLITLVFNDSLRGDAEGFGDGSPRRVWVVFRRRLPTGPREPGVGTPEPDGGAHAWGRRAASRLARGGGPGPYRMATGATGVPVPPTNGSGIADSRKS
ncbi:hypothetical protein SGFS_054540 [Streptomyces graminofaciens]|uniref:Uncharacterized protein n=1 Tax=Streptomyces graminofaciens TaxID=68212 RepID=A0ABM8HLC0_9ACTN|nr:hypothetical protein SGFS_054540 [Streptomyces graminofaciens]